MLACGRYGHWLGNGNLPNNKKETQPFLSALSFARSLNLKSRAEWELWRKNHKRPAGIPSTPHRTYKDDGWQGCVILRDVYCLT